MFESKQTRCCRRRQENERHGDTEDHRNVGLFSPLRAEPFTHHSLALLLYCLSGWLLAHVARHWNYPSTSCMALPFAMLGHGIIWIYAITMFGYGLYCMHCDLFDTNHFARIFFSHRFEIVVRRRVNKPLAERKRFSMLDAYSPIANTSKKKRIVYINVFNAIPRLIISDKDKFGFFADWIIFFYVGEKKTNVSFGSKAYCARWNGFFFVNGDADIIIIRFVTFCVCGIYTYVFTHL